MRRTISDVIRRGFDSTLANWQVVLIRIGESFAIGLIVLLSIIAVIVPIVVSAGLTKWTAPAGRTPAEMVTSFLTDHFALIVWVFAVLVIVMGIAIALHSFISAGAARTFIDAEQKTAGAPVPTRDAYAAFTSERFFAEARRSWWRVFWIYNATWSVAGLILLIPIVITFVLLIPTMASDSAPAMVAVSCGGLALIVVVAFPVAIITAIWTQRAILICIAADTAVRDALRAGWRVVRGDFVRHLVVGVIIMVISMGVGMLLSGVLAPMTLMSHDTGLYAALVAPPRLVISMLQNAISNGISCWFIAAFAAMMEERA